MAFLPSIFTNHENSHFPSSSPQDFHGVPDFMMGRSMPLISDDEGSDDGSQMLGEKKRRLNLEQVKALEKSFESGNKLDPQRKTQLARALGLQPRQIAIWFQNRRARWKTKQLEKDYDILKRQFEAIKADNDALKSQNQKLHSQLLGLKTRESTPINLNKENEWSNGSESGCQVNLKTSDNRLYLNQQTKLHAAGFPTPPSNDCTFGNMFGGIQETQEFWPWSDNHNNFQ